MHSDDTKRHAQEILKTHVSRAVDEAAALQLPREAFVMELYRLSNYMVVKMGLEQGMSPVELNSFMSGYVRGIIELKSRSMEETADVPQ